MNKVEHLLSSRPVVFFDGAMGTMLQQNGMPRGIRSDAMCILMPETVEAIHRSYIAAGSNIICTNTFGASHHALRGTGYTPEQIISAGIGIAKRAAGENALVAFDMGPIGELLAPSGELTYEDAYKMFYEQAILAEKYGADLVAIETMGDIEELRAAVCAVQENTSLLVFATMTFMENNKTYMGATARELAELAACYNLAAFGINCSLPPDKMLSVASELSELSDIPLIIKLNAGMPESDGSYSLTPEEYALSLLPYRGLNIKIIGACCGSSPEFIKALKKSFGG